MKIAVTTEDIEAGRRRDPSECPVARALRRAGICHFGVTGMLVIVQTGRNHVPLVLPAQVQEWILDFDWGSAMKPMDFELAVPEEQKRRQEDQDTVWRRPESAGMVVADPKPPGTNACSRGGLRLPRLPGLGLSARNLLGRPFRRCRAQGKVRNRATAGIKGPLVSS